MEAVEAVEVELVAVELVEVELVEAKVVEVEVVVAVEGVEGLEEVVLVEVVPVIHVAALLETVDCGCGARRRAARVSAFCSSFESLWTAL